MTYLEQVKADVKDYIETNDWNIDLEEYETAEEFEEFLNDELWINDSVTGNASGSYYCNSYKAMEEVKENLPEVMEALTECGYNAQDIGNMFISEEWEKLDVIARCFYLEQAISEVLEEMEIEEVIEQLKEEKEKENA